jgi:hypothetical protein
MIHLTHTGYNAGRPLCNCHKSAHKAMGDTFIACLHASVDLLQSDALCLACKAVLENGADDAENDMTPIEWLDAEEIAPSLGIPVD